jgi:alanyl-tRNA synthetase
MQAIKLASILPVKSLFYKLLGLFELQKSGKLHCMKASEIRKAYLDFFTSQGHKVIPSSSLLPENDPTTLFTGSGMQPMVPYLLGETHPLGTRIADSQKCIRTQDIEEVGDNRHTTFFEMLGNWSLGDYFKAEQIPWMFEFLTDKIGLDPARLYVTVFAGDAAIRVARDDEAIQLWQAQFASKNIEAKFVENAEKNGLQDGRIFSYDASKNWWSRAGTPDKMPVGEPGGPDTEMFWDFDPEENLGLHAASEWKDRPCHVNCDCGRFLEIGNNVFMEFKRGEKGFEKLAQQNVDFGGGLERLAAAVNNDPDVFQIDLFAEQKQILETLSGKKYGANEAGTFAFRVVLDHLRGATFLTADGAPPSNKDQGYFTRRMLRRAIRFASKLGITEHFCARVSEAVIDTYREAYPELVAKKDKILVAFDAEETQFKKTLEKGEKELTEVLEKGEQIDGARAFYFYETYGFPLELTEEFLAERNDKFTDHAGFETAAKAHADSSRTAAAGKFKGGLADSSAETTALHTTAHLMLEAMRRVLGPHVEQRGSNITAERLRFDFSHETKLTDAEVTQIEELVNSQIAADLPVSCTELSVEEAKKLGATGIFDDKYAQLDKVKVYSVGDFSREICGGPHVEHLGDIGKFKIQKQEASSSGVRRIKAVLIKN